MVEALRYKLRMFEVTLDVATNVFCDKKAVYKTPSCRSQPSGRSITPLLTKNVGKQSQLIKLRLQGRGR